MITKDGIHLSVYETRLNKVAEVSCKLGASMKMMIKDIRSDLNNRVSLTKMFRYKVVILALINLRNLI